MANAPKNVGRYSIEEEVGKGGMAKVYTAYDPNVKRKVALKLMSTHLTDDEEFRARFRREAEAVAALEHVGIVPIYDFGEDDNQLYIVMRLMGGGTLKDKINKGPLSIEEAAKTLRRIALALDKAHENGIIHRDLKPGNILYDQDGEGYIADFGVAHLAKSGEELTGTGALIGTPAYMSPEQVRGANDEVDGRSDIYSLGVILFEMLSGSTPYNSDTPMGTALMHLLEPVPRVLDSNPNLPPTIEEIIDTAMAKEKEDRFDKAKDMADALDEVIAGSYMPTQKLQDGDKIKEIVASKKPRGKKRVVFGVLLIAIVTVVAFLLFQGGAPVIPADDQPTQDGAVAVVEEASPTIVATQVEVTVVEAPTEEITEVPTEVAVLVPLEMSLSNVGQVSLAGILGRGTINEIAVSPNGDMVAVAGSLGVWLYDVETLELISNFETSDASLINSVAWSPVTEGLRIVTGGEDGSVRIWNPTTGQQLLKIDAHLEPVNSVAWSPSGDMIASGSDDNTIKFWNPATGNPRFTLEGHPNDVTNVMWSPDGLRFVSSGWTVYVWDISRQLNLVVLGGHTDQIESMAWSPDGTQLISASSDNTMRVWNIVSADLITPVEGQESPVYGVSWSPNGEYVVQSAGTDVLVRNPEMGIETILEGHKANATHFAWLENGDKLISVSSAGEIMLWDTASWELLVSNFAHTGQLASATISPDGTTVASGSADGILRLWNVSSGEQLALIVAHDGSVNDIDWSPDGSKIATAGSDGFGKVFDAVSLDELRLLLGHTKSVDTVAYSPDGSMIATTSADLTIRIWNSSEGTEINQFGQNDPINDLVWSPDGVRVALSSGEKLLIRNALDTITIFTLSHDATVNGIAWAPNGKWIATTAEDKTVNVWNAERGIRESNSFFGHTKASVSVAWSSNSTMLFSASRGGEIIVWDVASGVQVHILTGHTDGITKLVLLDDVILISSSEDGTIRIWTISS